MHRNRLLVRIAMAIFLAGFSSEILALNVSEVRAWNSPDRTRIVFDFSNKVSYQLFELNKPDRIVIDVKNGNFTGSIPQKSKLGSLVSAIRIGEHKSAVRFVLDLNAPVKYKHFTLGPNEIYGDRLVLDIHPLKKSTAKAKKRKPVKKTEFLVVIDAGHGGEDPGAIGSRRTFEKHLVLQIAKRLKKELDKQSGIRAELTRKGDYYIPLRRRTRIAVEKNADLFISIHADSFKRKSANGISVFALSNRGATSERARVIANKENSSDMLGGEDLADIDDAVVEVLADLALDKQIERSLDLGGKVRARLSKVGRLHGHGVEQAGFVVLKTPQIPSILVEVGFISNPKEERRLNTRDYQAKLVRSIRSAVVQFAKENPWSQEEWRTARN